MKKWLIGGLVGVGIATVLYGGEGTPVGGQGASIDKQGPDGHTLTITVKTNFFEGVPGGMIAVRGNVTSKEDMISFYPRIALAAKDAQTKVAELQGTAMKMVHEDKSEGAFVAELGKTNFFFCVAGGPSKGGGSTVYSGRGNVFVYATRGDNDYIDQRISNLIVADVDFDHGTVVSINSQQ